MKRLFTTILGLAVLTIASAQQLGTTTFTKFPAHVASVDKAPGDTLYIYPPAVDTCQSTNVFTYPYYGTYSVGGQAITGVAQKFIYPGTAKVLALGCYIQLLGSGVPTAYTITVNGGTTSPGSVLGTGTLAFIDTLSAADSVYYAAWIFPAPVDIANQFYAEGTTTSSTPGDTIRYLLTECSSGNSFLNAAGTWLNTAPAPMNFPFDISFEALIIEGQNTSGINESIIGAAGLMPNPAHDYSLLTYNVTENAKVNVKIMNVAGQVVQQINEGAKQPGTYITRIDVKDMAAGTYFYQITANGHSSTGRLVVAK